MTRLDARGISHGLADAEVDYVLTGSVAATAYGINVEPRDFDVAPDAAPANLHRLAALLRAWDARPQHDPDWPESISPDDAERWHPYPATAEQLDHLLVTPHGLLDVVPWRSRRYEDLSRRALVLEADGLRVLVAHPDDLIATLRLNKPKHRERIPHLEAARERVERGDRELRVPWAQ